MRRDRAVVVLARVDDLVQQTLKETHHRVDEVDVRGLDDHATVVADEDEARLDEPVEHVVDHLYVVLVDVSREVVLHVGAIERPPAELVRLQVDHTYTEGVTVRGVTYHMEGVTVRDVTYHV